MPISIRSEDNIAYLQQFLPHNKARGMIAEISLAHEIGLVGEPSLEKLLVGGWLLSPRTMPSQNYRFIVFVLPEMYQSPDEIAVAVRAYEGNRGWQTLATYLSHSGIGVIISAAWSDNPIAPIENMQWRNFVYRDERLHPSEGDQPYSLWPGDRGRPSRGGQWQADVLGRFGQANAHDLTSLMLRQAFYNSYLKQKLRKPIDDPYDVDGFLVGYAGTVMPIEIKEKSPTPEGSFGLDAGRILMFLRLCLATDSNALYLIREVDNSTSRSLVNWRYITLADMVMGCKWNLQAGGIGMGGGNTQTVMMPGALFGSFTKANLSEDWLAKQRSLSEAVRVRIVELSQGLSQYLAEP